MTPPWATPTVIDLIAAALHVGDASRLPVLADALEDAGFDHPECLAHLRGCSLYALGSVLNRIASELGLEQRRRDWAVQVPDHFRHYWVGRPGRTAKSHVRKLSSRIPRTLCGVYGGLERLAERPEITVDEPLVAAPGDCRTCVTIFNGWQANAVTFVPTPAPAAD